MMLKSISILSCSIIASAIAAAVSDRDAQPIKPPVPKYPMQAAMTQTSGFCEVTFDVDRKGQLVAPRAECSNPVFCHEVLRAMSEVEYAPKIVDGAAVPRYGVVYPIEFTISNAPGSDGFDPLKPCGLEKERVS